MEAIILAGGLGTRLRSVVPDLPKPMAPVGGRPFLAWLLDTLVEAGFGRAVLAVSYRHEVIQGCFGERYRSLSLAYSVEPEPRGTGGAIRLALGRIATPQVFVVNGDTWLDMDYAAMAAAHLAADARLSMAVAKVPDVARYGALALAGGRVRGFLEKGRAGPGAINGGVYLMATSLFDGFVLPEAFSFEADFLMPHVSDLQPLAVTAPGAFIDIGIPADYARAQALLAGC
ncbi:MAG TPA: D-glycero-D-manno-heptose 1-phosphate guanosyltransferase [Gammaproteobacteria bacterium]|nr:D-glycero-D-manno-heptose 1-phosphate guanosyltransferase [Gammaproteobacteria bacterium]